MLIEKFPDEDHGHGVEFAVAEQGFAQGTCHASVAEHQFVVGRKGRAAVGDGYVFAHLLKHIVIDNTDAKQTTY